MPFPFEFFEKVHLPLRIAQLVLSFLVLAISAAALHYFNAVGAGSPGPFSFLLFAALWSMLSDIGIIVGIFGVAPLFKNEILLYALEFLNFVFLFAGFIAAANGTQTNSCGVYDQYYNWTKDVFYKDLKNICTTTKAASVFGAFLWLLWAFTTVPLAVKFWNFANTKFGSGTPPPANNANNAYNADAPNNNGAPATTNPPPAYNDAPATEAQAV